MPRGRKNVLQFHKISQQQESQNVTEFQNYIVIIINIIFIIVFPIEQIYKTLFRNKRFVLDYTFGRASCLVILFQALVSVF